MLGLEAIAQNNGWMIAFTGICIIFTGLSTLSLIISQLHKLVSLLDRPPKTMVEVVVEKKIEGRSRPDCPSDLNLTIQVYQPLIEELDLEFDLADLYALAKKYHLPHPHLSIRCLRDAGKLQSLGGGIFHLLK